MDPSSYELPHAHEQGGLGSWDFGWLPGISPRVYLLKALIGLFDCQLIRSFELDGATANQPHAELCARSNEPVFLGSSTFQLGPNRRKVTLSFLTQHRRIKIR